MVTHATSHWVCCPHQVSKRLTVQLTCTCLFAPPVGREERCISPPGSRVKTHVLGVAFFFVSKGTKSHRVFFLFHRGGNSHRIDLCCDVTPLAPRPRPALTGERARVPVGASVSASLCREQDRPRREHLDYQTPHRGRNEERRSFHHVSRAR